MGVGAGLDGRMVWRPPSVPGGEFLTLCQLVPKAGVLCFPLVYDKDGVSSDLFVLHGLLETARSWCTSAAHIAIDLSISAQIILLF